MEASTRFTVDVDLCQRATEQLRWILRKRQRASLRRWHSSRRLAHMQRALRVVGMLLSLVGAASSGYLVLGALPGRSVCISLLGVPVVPSDYVRTAGFFLLTLFVAFFAIFYLQPDITRRLRSRMLRAADRRSHRIAQMIVGTARALAPFEAQYDFKNDLFVYARGRNGEWTLGWSRKLGTLRGDGQAVQAASVTVIFRRSWSRIPIVTILHEDPEVVGQALHSAGIAIERKAAQMEWAPS